MLFTGLCTVDVFEMLDGKRKSGVRWDGRWKPVPVLNSAIPAASLDCATDQWLIGLWQVWTSLTR